MYWDKWINIWKGLVDPHSNHIHFFLWHREWGSSPQIWRWNPPNAHLSNLCFPSPGTSTSAARQLVCSAQVVLVRMFFCFLSIFLGRTGKGPMGQKELLKDRWSPSPKRIKTGIHRSSHSWGSGNSHLGFRIFKVTRLPWWDDSLLRHIGYSLPLT